MNGISCQVISGRLQKPPVSALVVSNVRLDLVLHLSISDEHTFNPCYLGTRGKKYDTNMNMNIHIYGYSALDCQLIKPLNYADTSAHSAIAEARRHAPDNLEVLL